MADAKISQLPVATTPLAGTELVPVVQGGVTDQTTVEAILTGTVPSGTANGVLYLNSSKVVTSGSALTFDGTGQLVVNRPSGSAGLILQSNDASTSYLFFGDQTSASVGRIEYDHGTNAMPFFANGTEQMRLNSTGLGIGTNNPGYRLQVDGASTAGFVTPIVAKNPSTNAASAAKIGFDAGGTIWGEIGASYNSNDPYMAFFVRAGSEKMRLTDSGNLGLGVTPSATGASQKSLEVGLLAAIVSNPASDTSTNVAQNAYYDGTNWIYRNTSVSAARYEMTGANSPGSTHAWYVSAGGTAGNPITFTQAMTLDASGRLGIGTTAPDQLLHIKAATNPVIRLEGASDSGYVDYNGTRLQLSSGGGALYFVAGNTERARITSGGDLLVGTASNTGYGGSVISKSAADVNPLAILNTSATNPYGIAIDFTGAAPNDTTRYFLTCSDTGGERATIRSNGGLANYQSNDVDLSDARTKKDITPAPSYWSKIGALEIVTYKYKDQTHDDINVGVIAQQVEQVEPVWVDADGFGETPEGEEPLKTVYTKDITFAAIKALQEAMIRIEQLEGRLAAAGI